MGNGIGGHVSDEAMEQYALGTLPEPQAAPLEEHLLTCPQCQDLLEQTDAFLAATRSAARKLMSESPRRPIQLWLWAAALAVGLVLFLSVAQPWHLLNRAGGPPVAVLLRSVRGPEGIVGSGAPHGKPLVLVADLAELPAFGTFRLEIVDSQGSRVGSFTAAPKDGKIAVPVARPLSAGAYWVRLYSPSGDLLREFGLKVE
jgi:hypothetical protein